MEENLDEQIAVEVMGWHIERVTPPGERPFDNYVDASGVGQCKPEQFSPSTNIARAFDVVEKMREQDYGFRIYAKPGGGSYEVDSYLFGATGYFSSSSLTLPKAICEVSLAAKRSATRKVPK